MLADSSGAAETCTWVPRQRERKREREQGARVTRRTRSRSFFSGKPWQGLVALGLFAVPSPARPGQRLWKHTHTTKD